MTFRKNNRPLKHSLAKDDDQVILFVKDPQRAVKDYFEQHGHGGVTRILGVEKLRKRYGTFEARRELMGMYDRFLVDKRVAPMMPRLLGKAFIDSKKMPLVVDLSHDATAAVRRALASTKYTPRRGTSCAIQFGTQSLTTEQLAENLETVMRGLLEKFSRGVDHGLRGRETIQSVSIKTDLSPALPLYVTLPSVIGGGKPKSDTMQQEKKTENTKNKKAGELATTGKAENEDSENGDDQNVGDGVSDNDDDVKLEVQYTDGEDDDDVDDDDDGEEEEEDKLVDDGSKIDADSTRKDENKVIKPEGKSKKGAKPKKVITKSNNNKPKHKAGPQRRKGNHGRGVGKSPRKADKKGHGSEDSGDKENDAPGGTKKTTPSNKKQVLGNGESNKTSNRPLIKRNAGAQKKTPRAASADRRKPKTVRKR